MDINKLEKIAEKFIKEKYRKIEGSINKFAINEVKEIKSGYIIKGDLLSCNSNYYDDYWVRINRKYRITGYHIHIDD